MKLIQKTIIPIILLIAVILVGIAYFSRAALEHALIQQEFERIKIISERANLPEVGDEAAHDELGPHEEGGAEAGRIINREHFESPKAPTSRLAFQRYMVEFKDPTVKQIYIADNEGKIIATNVQNSTLTKLTPVGLAVLNGQGLYSISTESGGDFLHSYIPFIFDGRLVGAAEIKSDLSHVLRPIHDEMNQIILRLIFTGLVALAVIYTIEKLIIIKPIEYLQLQAQAIGRGNLNKKVALNSSDELGVLAQFFENMRQRLKISREAEEAKLEASIQSLKFGFIILDENKNVLMANNAANAILGKIKNSTGFKALTSYFRDKFNLTAAYQRCVATKEAVVSGEIDAGDKTFKVSLFPIVTEKVIGVVVIIDDITEAVLLVRKKEEFFTVAAHELRTPLTSIRGNMSMIKDYYKEKMNDPQVIDMVSHAYDSSIRLIKIVNDFLDASKFENGASITNIEKVDMVKIAMDVVTEITAVAKAKGLRLIYNPNPKLPPVLADPTRLKQVIYNFVGNAVNYTQQGAVEVQINPEGDYLKLTVKDSGIGISPQNQRLLFQKFQQAGKTVLSRDGSVGTGMGLYISKLLINAMKGNIGLLESSNKGSIFFFTIPIAKV